MSSHVKSYLQLYTWKEQLKEKDNYSCMSSLSGSLFVSLSFLFIQMIWEPIFQNFIYLLIHDFFKTIHQILSDIVYHIITTKIFFPKNFILSIVFYITFYADAISKEDTPFEKIYVLPIFWELKLSSAKRDVHSAEIYIFLNRLSYNVIAGNISICMNFPYWIDVYHKNWILACIVF